MSGAGSSVTLRLDSDIRWGKVAAVGVIEGERYYWFVDRHGTVSMLPACVVEKT